jgi:hypothetical protein
MNKSEHFLGLRTPDGSWRMLDDGYNFRGGVTAASLATY